MLKGKVKASTKNENTVLILRCDQDCRYHPTCRTPGVILQNVSRCLPRLLATIVVNLAVRLGTSIGDMSLTLRFPNPKDVSMTGEDVKTILASSLFVLGYKAIT